MQAPSRAGGVLLLTVCVACSDGPVQRPATSVSDSAGIVVVSNVLDERVPTCTVSPNPTLTIGVTEGAPEYQLYRTFGARRLSDGRIAVVNQGSQELRFYDQTGTFLRAAGRQGAGPGEFTNAFTLQVTKGDTLWVGDYRPWEYEVFAPDGSWVRMVRPDPPYVNTDVADVLDSGRVVIVSRSFGTTTIDGVDYSTRSVVLHDQDKSIIDTIGVFLGSMVESEMFGAGGRLVAEGQRLVEGHTSAPEIRVYEIRDSSRLSMIVRWSGEAVPVTQEHIAADRVRLTESFANVSPELRQQLLDPQIREDRPIARTFPRFSSVELGRDGRIWVRAHRRPDTTGADEWLIFEPEGILSCTATIEPFEQMPDFGSDYILVMRRDSIGVERIYQHELSRPTPPAQ